MMAARTRASTTWRSKVREKSQSRGWSAPPRYSAFLGRDGGFGGAHCNGAMAATGVVSAVSRDLEEVAFDLPEQIGEDFAVAPVGGADLDTDDALLSLIHGHMDLALLIRPLNSCGVMGIFSGKGA